MSGIPGVSFVASMKPSSIEPSRGPRGRAARGCLPYRGEPGRAIRGRARVPQAPSLRSAQAGGLQRVVRVDDVAQAILERAVASVRVRVEPLHQDLVLGLDGRRVGGLVE